ncbi:MAG: DivIVA domain-containing protein [Clostridia bacterium]|nr:DivIVA domain-containing protein [Clostridia bacterium]
MLSPGELKKRQFTKSLRGYSTVEVDEQMDFIIDKYTELYVYADGLEKEVARLEGELKKVKENEDAIRRAMVNAQKEERKVIDEANDRAALILRTAKMNTDKMLAEFKAKIREERMTLFKLRRAVKEFKENSLKQYELHLEFLNQISSDVSADDPALELTEDDYANSLLEQMRIDLENSARESERLEEEAGNSPVRRAPGAGEGKTDRARTTVFEAMRRKPKPKTEGDTKEVPRAAGDTREIPRAPASTREIPPVRKTDKPSS